MEDLRSRMSNPICKAPKIIETFRLRNPIVFLSTKIINNNSSSLSIRDSLKAFTRMRRRKLLGRQLRVKT